MIAFYTLVITILFCGVAIILSIWDVLPNPEIRDRLLLTVVVLSTASLLICMISWAFLTAETDGQKEELENSPLGRALQKAKTVREEASEDSAPT